MARASAGPLIEGVAGKFSGLVVQNSKSGLVIRRQARFKKYQNSAQSAVTARLRAAAAVWNGLDFQQAGVWEDYAQTVTLHNHLTGHPYHPSGYNAFLALATKVLQLDPLATVPTSPPTGEFIGDAVTLSLGTGSASMLGDKGPACKALNGSLEIVASAPNTSGTTTELLLEKLPNERRKASGRLVSAGFHQFAAGHLQCSRDLEAGWYVAGYRFVETATGRQTLAQVIGRVQVVVPGRDTKETGQQRCPASFVP